MPLVSPENRTKRRRRSRSRSPKCLTPPADGPSQVRERDHHHKDTSRHGRRDEHDRHRFASPDSRSSDKRNYDRRRDVKRDDQRADRDRSGADTARDREDRSRRDRRLDRTLVANAKIKEEPMSEDEESKRRNRRSRLAAAAAASTAANRHDETGGDFRQRRRPVKEEGGGAAAGAVESNKPKEKVNFGLSGKLAEDTNVYNGVVIKYNEPTEARKPGKRWRLYPFKGDEALPMLPVHRQSAYLLGRDRKVADIPIDHPSCSKQHAVLQFRAVQYTRDDGRPGRRIRPYIIDLESANGTFVNNARIEAKRYLELMERDVVKFGFSSREYVLLHEGSATVDEDDDSSSEMPAAADDAATEEAEAVQADAERSVESAD